MDVGDIVRAIESGEMSDDEFEKLPLEVQNAVHDCL